MSLRGFVDLQANGYRGVDFAAADLGEDAAVAALRGLMADGTAVFLPTLITAAEAVYARNLPLLARVMARREFADCCPGIHLEGPFLCPREGAAGAHSPALMRPADLDFLDRLQAWAAGRIRLMTVAPDVSGAPDLIRHARGLGITVSLGHHLADAAQVSAACDAGATLHTHLGNGLPHLVHRHANPLIDALAEDRIVACIIGDGHHLPWSLVRVILKAKGIGRSILVSDVAPCAGMPPGRYGMFGADVEMTSAGRLCNPATGYLMGSAQTIRQVANATRTALSLSDRAIYQLAIANPLRAIGYRVPCALAGLPRASDGDWLPPT